MNRDFPHPFLFASFLWLLGSATAAAAEPLPARIVVLDQVVSAGQPVVIRARVERVTLLRQPVGGELVSFAVDGRPLGTVLTGGDGVAVHEAGPLPPGLHQARAALLPRGGQYTAETVTGMVAVWRATERLLLIHLEDAVLIRPTPRLFRFDRAADWRVADQADVVLRALRRTFHLVFFTTQPEDHLPRLKAWLSRHRLPPAPLLVWPGDADAIAARIAEIRESGPTGWPGLKAGVGSSAADAEAFLDQDLTAVILEGEEGEPADLPEGTVSVADWRGAARHLRR